MYLAVESSFVKFEEFVFVVIHAVQYRFHIAFLYKVFVKPTKFANIVVTEEKTRENQEREKNNVKTFLIILVT